MNKIRVIVIDDSAFMRKYISDMITTDPQFEIIDVGINGLEAIEKVRLHKPDVITMDIEMPVMNGLEALKQLMKEHTIPVIMLSSFTEKNARETIMALELGAFDFIEKPTGFQVTNMQQASLYLTERLHEAVKARNVERVSITDRTTVVDLHKPSFRSGKQRIEDAKLRQTSVKKIERPLIPSSKDPIKPLKPTMPVTVVPRDVKRDAPIPVPVLRPELSVDKAKEMDKNRSITFTSLVAVGTSTGGPRALKELLSALPADFPAPVVIVQHMPANFTKSLAQRLDSFSHIRVTEAEDGELLEAGTAYVAPGGYHMSVVRQAKGKYAIALDKSELRNGHRPSVDVLYESLIQLDELQRHLVLLTGMGSDGAKAMKTLVEHGVTSTIAESEQTCVVYGMPRSAVELHAAQYVLPIHDIAPKLTRLVK